MNAEQMIDRNKRAKEMDALLQAEMPKGADHVQLTKLVEGQQKLIRFLGETLVRQGTAIVEMRKHILSQQNAIETLANLVEAEQEPANGLIGFDKPKLEIN